MRWGIALNVRERVSETLQKAVVADRGGIEQIWVTDFPATKYAPAVAAAIADRTTSCRIGVGLVSPLLYSSTQIIQFMSTLIDGYGERFDLLLGPGDRHALARIGPLYSTKTMVEKTIGALTEIKIGLSERGYENSVFLGAQGPVMIKASLKAEGVLLNYSDIEIIKWALSQIKERIPDDFHIGVFFPTFVGECQDIMSNQGIALSAAMVAIGLNSKTGETFGLRDKIQTARSMMMKKGLLDSEIVESLGKEILQRFAFCGTESQLIEYLRLLRGVGITSVVFGPPQGIRKRGVDILVRAKAVFDQD